MKEKKYFHHTILSKEVIESLNIKPNGIYLDCTFGHGGHSKLILSKLDQNGRVIAIDRDPESVNLANKIIDPRFSIIYGKFSLIFKYIKQKGLLGLIDGIILDLGVSSFQIDNPERGFSFQRNGPLDMRMDTNQNFSAKKWLFKACEKEIAQVLKNFGEERFYKRIAKVIYEQKTKKPIIFTKELSDLIKKNIPYWNKNKHPATLSFQAIRIFVNNELQEIELALKNILEILAPGGKLLIISFHSLEARIIKNFFNKKNFKKLKLISSKDELNKILNLNNIFFLKIKKKIKPSNLEIRNNPRSRSAVLRIAEKLSYNDLKRRIKSF